MTNNYIETWNENIKAVNSDEARIKLLSKLYDEGFEDGYNDNATEICISYDRFDKSWVKEQWIQYCESKGQIKLSVIEFTCQCLEKMREVANGNI